MVKQLQKECDKQAINVLQVNNWVALKRADFGFCQAQSTIENLLLSQLTHSLTDFAELLVLEIVDLISNPVD